MSANLKITEDTVREALMQVIDPEFDFDIVNLGLVYYVIVEDSKVAINMTMTDPACPIADQIVASARAVVKRTFAIEDVAVSVVWSPRWSWEMMSDEAKICMGYPV